MQVSMKLFLRELSLQMITEYLTWRDTPAAEANPSPSGRTSKANQAQANPRDKKSQNLARIKISNLILDLSTLILQTMRYQVSDDT
jgi:hypothetical protein